MIQIKIKGWWWKRFFKKNRRIKVMMDGLAREHSLKVEESMKELLLNGKTKIGDEEFFYDANKLPPVNRE